MAIKDFRLVARVFNNQLRERREEAGLTATAFAQKAGIHLTTYCGLEALRISPLTSGRRGGFGKPEPITWTVAARRIAEALGVDPGVLWTDEHKAIRETKKEIRANAEEIHQLSSLPAATGPFGLLCAAEEREAISSAVSTLTEREQQIINMRFSDESSLQEIADALGISRERVRQVEARALRKLRHPARSNKLRQFIDASSIDIAEVKP